MTECVIYGEEADGLYERDYCKKCEEVLAKFYDTFFGDE